MNYTKSFLETRVSDIALVDGKNASLGELCRHLTPSGIRVLEGFAVTAGAFRLFISDNKLAYLIIKQLQATLDTDTY